MGIQTSLFPEQILREEEVDRFAFVFGRSQHPQSFHISERLLTKDFATESWRKRRTNAAVKRLRIIKGAGHIPFY